MPDLRPRGPLRGVRLGSLLPRRGLVRLPGRRRRPAPIRTATGFTIDTPHRLDALDRRPATTHWTFADAFRTHSPKVRLDPRLLYVDDGQVLTPGGTTAGMDLCLHVVRPDHGAEVANGVVRLVVMPPHREGGQAQYIDQPITAPVASLYPWLRAQRQ